MLTHRKDPIEENHWQEEGWEIRCGSSAQYGESDVKVLKGKWVWRQEFKGVLC